MSEEAKKRKGSPDAATVEVRIKLSEAVDRADRAEADSKRLRASLKSALVALNRLVMRGDAFPISYYKGRAEEVRAALRGKP